ncbi:hypothetical protein [Acidianus ambivalens]|uniref:hypothetical protein n=1 Tax=Acidianus ambivalens TaxID=2283 RepID=UPI001E5CC626|nr:hypothetical protein [Acidianus ambivalens]
MVEEKLISHKINRKAYIKARIIETLDDIDVAIHMWIAGRSRNSSAQLKLYYPN